MEECNDSVGEIVISTIAAMILHSRCPDLSALAYRIGLIVRFSGAGRTVIFLQCSTYYSCYCRFHVTFQSVFSIFVANVFNYIFKFRILGGVFSLFSKYEIVRSEVSVFINHRQFKCSNESIKRFILCLLMLNMAKLITNANAVLPLLTAR